MNFMKNKKWKWDKVFVYALSVMYITLVCGNNAYAIQDTVLVTGTKKLAADALVAVQVIAAPIALLLFGWFKFQEMAAGDEGGEQTKFKKLQRVVVVAVVVIELIGTLAGTLGGYYGIKFS